MTDTEYNATLQFVYNDNGAVYSNCDELELMTKAVIKLNYLISEKVKNL